MLRIDKQLRNKGIVAVAVLAVSGYVGAANFVQAAPGDKPSKEQCRASGYENYGQCVRVWAQDDSGYGNSGTNVVAAADAFETAIDQETDIFTNRVSGLSDEVHKSLDAEGRTSTDAFDARFSAATAAYDDDLDEAFDNFRSDVENAADTAETRNEFIDRFNRAKAEYLNALDVSKNQYAAELSNMGHGANVAKDRFMNGFNAVRDSYSNKLEEAKNAFADSIR